MRIFSAVRHSNNPDYYYGGLWSSNFYPALKKLGHEIVESKTDLFPTSKFMMISRDFTRDEMQKRAETTESIMDEFKQARKQGPIDLVLSYFYNAHFDPSAFSEIRKLEIPSVNFYCNSIYQFDLVADIASAVDYSWHAEKHAKQSYLDVGANPVWVQMGADPELYSPVAGINRHKKAMFLGQRYADRDRYLEYLISNEIPVDIFGPGWTIGKIDQLTSKSDGEYYLGRYYPAPGSYESYSHLLKLQIKKQGILRGLSRYFSQYLYKKKSEKTLGFLLNHVKQGHVNYQELRSVFSSYEVCLNFSNVWLDGKPGSPLIPHVRLRDFEAPMCRTCYLTGHTDEISEFYVIGKEIDTYHSREELADKTMFYLNNPEAAEKLREAGYKRAVRDHTWSNRFSDLFQKLHLANKR